MPLVTPLGPAHFCLKLSLNLRMDNAVIVFGNADFWTERIVSFFIQSHFEIYVRFEAAILDF